MLLTPVTLNIFFFADFKWKWLFISFVAVVLCWKLLVFKFVRIYVVEADIFPLSIQKCWISIGFESKSVLESVGNKQNICLIRLWMEENNQTIHLNFENRNWCWLMLPRKSKHVHLYVQDHNLLICNRFDHRKIVSRAIVIQRFLWAS